MQEPLIVEGGNLEVMGAGSLWEVEEEMAGGGIPKVVGTGKNRKTFLQHCVIFCNRKKALFWDSCDEQL